MSKTAIVLAGGGSRGGYQIGVWQALRELGIEYQIVTGTSVGALNGALMVQGNYEVAKTVWENLSSQDVLEEELAQTIQGVSNPQIYRAFAKEVIAHGGADITPLENLINTIVDEDLFRNSPVDFALVTVEYPSLKPLEITKAEIPEGMLSEYLLASAACFPAFKTREIDGAQYMDGGYHDNLPINLALNLGADSIIAVDLESVGRIRKVKASNKKITTIRCGWSLGTFLVFDPEMSKRNMRLGYLDTLKAFGKLKGTLYAFQRESCQPVTKRLHASESELLAAAKKLDSTLANTLERLLLHRLLRDYRNRIGDPLPFTVGQQILMAAEYCGELLDLDPTPIYDLEDFNQKLLETFQETFHEPITQPTNLLDLPKLRETLREYEKKHLLTYFVQRIREFYAGGKGAELLFLAGGFSKEFTAALYLCCLGNLLPSKNKEDISNE